MSLKISIPGKSFVAGEYLAVEGGPSLVAALGPRFTLEVLRESAPSSLTGIHIESPAGKFYLKNQASFKGYQLKFVDPHQGQGGWGASTAQFACIYALCQWRESILFDAERSLDLREMLSAYRDICDTGEGALPSGADLVAQVRGGLTFFDRTKGQLKCYKWPFNKIGLAFVRTGEKLATHEHLKSLNDLDFTKEFVSSVVMAREALEVIDAEQFVMAINSFRSALSAEGLEYKKTRSLVEDVKTKNFCLAAKGCGAMGVDTLMIVFQSGSEVGLEAWVKEKGLELVATHQNLESGIDLKLEAGFPREFTPLAEL